MIYDNQILSKCANALTKDQEFILANQLFQAYPLAKFPKLISQPSRINLEALADLPQRYQEMLAYVAKYGYVTSERAKLLVNGLICRIALLKQSWS